jgi:hypothetical protein
MQSYDPYQAPMAGAAPSTTGSSTELQATILEAMRQTKPWVTFLSILGFVGAGFLVLAGFLMSVVGAVGDAFDQDAFRGFGALVGVAYLLLGALYVVPSVLLWRYAASIGRLLQTAAMDQLAEAIVCQKSFWRFAGISAAVVIALYLVVIFVAVVAAFVAAASR